MMTMGMLSTLYRLHALLVPTRTQVKETLDLRGI